MTWHNSRMMIIAYNFIDQKNDMILFLRSSRSMTIKSNRKLMVQMYDQPNYKKKIFQITYSMVFVHIVGTIVLTSSHDIRHMSFGG